MKAKNKAVLSAILALSSPLMANAQIFENTDAQKTIPDSIVVGVGIERTSLTLPNGSEMEIPLLQFSADILSIQNDRAGGPTIAMLEVALGDIVNGSADMAFLNGDSGVGFGIELNQFHDSSEAILRAGWRPGAVLQSNGRDYVVMYGMMGMSGSFRSISPQDSKSGQQEDVRGANFSVGINMLAKISAFTLRAGFLNDTGSIERTNFHARLDYAVNNDLNLYGKLSHTFYGATTKFDQSEITQTRLGIEIRFKK